MFSNKVQDSSIDGCDIGEPDVVAPPDEQNESTGENQVVQREFVVDSEEAANSLVRSVKHEREYACRVEVWAATEIKRARRREEYLLQRYGHQVEAWLRRRLEGERDRRRSINLPAGSVGFRAAPAKVHVTDTTALLTWVKANLIDALQVQVSAVGSDASRLAEWQAAEGLESQLTESVSKRLVNAYVAEIGELPEGTGLEPAHDQLQIK
ncbi:MAG TPA: hypothetical protein VGR35_06925 [Tepidisphaeraceae bacterium]|nr:hypothetical protein [Tepidisphaeraceae bacterium]